VPEDSDTLEELSMRFCPGVADLVALHKAAAGKWTLYTISGYYTDSALNMLGHIKRSYGW
jgi:hypothetical protein